MCGMGTFFQHSLGTLEEPGTLTQGLFPWSWFGFLSFGNRTQNSRVTGARPNHQTIRGSDPNHQGPHPGRGVCVFITVVPITKLFACVWGGNNGGHVLRETMSPVLCGLVCPSRTSEHGGKGYCVKEGGGEEGDRERERVVKVRLR